MARALSHNIQSKKKDLEEECPICLEEISANDCMLTPCAHMFRRECLLSFIENNKRKDLQNIGKWFVDCPVCNETVNVDKIISISQSSTGETTSTFLSDVNGSKNMSPRSKKNDLVARKTLASALSGGTSAKLTSVLHELDKIWEVDPFSKVLVFSQYLGFLDLLELHLKKQNTSSFRLDGSMTLKERMDVLNNFQSEKETSPSFCSKRNSDICRGSVFLASMKAGGVGINLVAASSVFIVDPWWNAAIEDQCINRIHRIGQAAKIVRVRKFIVEDSVEEKITTLQKRKKDMASEILSSGEEGGAFTDSKPTLDDFKILFRR